MTQQQNILQYLESGGVITPLDALNMFGSLRLGSVIHRLRQDGHDIRTIWVSKNGKHFASYKLIKPVTIYDGKGQMVLT